MTVVLTNNAHIRNQRIGPRRVKIMMSLYGSIIALFAPKPTVSPP